MKSSAQPSTITVHVPMTFAIRGGRKMIISEVLQASDEALHLSHDAIQATSKSHCAAPRRTGNALLKALARGHRWRRMIETGEYASITELAKAERVNQSYACRLLRLTLLAPPIVVDILNGQHASDLMLGQLMKPLPVLWDKQIAALKITVRE
jgi:hypothetical protein